MHPLQSFLVHPFQRYHGRVGAERLNRCWQSSNGVGDESYALLRAKLVFKRRFDVGVNQELDSRRETVPCGVERKRRRAGKTVKFIFTGVDRVPAHDRHQPRMNQVISLYEASGESGWSAVKESCGSWCCGIQWQWDRSAR